MSTAAISLRHRIAGNARHNPLAAIGVVLILIFLTFALFAPWIAPQDPAAINLPDRLNSASRAHWFGTDELGRDILSRVIYGARISMLVGASVVATSLVLGLIIGPLVAIAILRRPLIQPSPALAPTLILAGLAVGVGAGLAGGCTSGHGVCGVSRLSRRSIVATGVFMTVGFLTASVLRHTFGA